MYVIDTEARPHKGDVKVDGLNWVNDGKRKQPKRIPRITKTFSKLNFQTKVRLLFFRKMFLNT